MEIYNLKQKNSLKENNVVKTKYAISTTKCLIILEIYSKYKKIEDFYEDIEGSEDKREKKLMLHLNRIIKVH